MLVAPHAHPGIQALAPTVAMTLWLGATAHWLASVQYVRPIVDFRKSSTGAPKFLSVTLARSTRMRTVKSSLGTGASTLCVAITFAVLIELPAQGDSPPPGDTRRVAAATRPVDADASAVTSHWSD